MEIQEVEKFFQEYKVICDEYEEVSKKKTDLYKKLTALEENIVAEFTKDPNPENHIHSFNSTVGTASWRKEDSVLVPNDEESRELFFSHLRDKGLYKSMISVNSQRLNAYFRKEREANGPDYLVPGLKLGEPRLIFSFRRK